MDNVLAFGKNLYGIANKMGIYAIKLFLGGVEEREFGDKFLSSIFQWNIAEQTWGNDELKIKNMANERSRFGISVVNIEDYEKKCNWRTF